LQATSPIAPPADPNGAEPLVQVGSISIPAIVLDSPMFEGIRLTTLNHGPGHWPGAASPGQVGNVVVAGHRTSHNAEFRRIDRLVPGDIVTPSTPDGVFDYSVVGTEIVGPDAPGSSTRPTRPPPRCRLSPARFHTATDRREAYPQPALLPPSNLLRDARDGRMNDGAVTVRPPCPRRPSTSTRTTVSQAA
jgi:hypothetical protein